MKKGYAGFSEAIATLVGCVIGAGIFGIPYAIAKVGFLIGGLYIFILGLIIMISCLYLGEVCLRTKGIHQLTGYAQKYLGRKGKFMITFSMTFIIVGAMIAYLIGEGGALSAIFGGNPFFYSVIFFLVMSVLVFFDLKAIKESEVFLSWVMIIFITGIILFSLPSAKLSNLYHLDLSNIFLPYGVILFAFLGSVAIPEMNVELGRNKKLLKRAIIIGMLIPLIIYASFAAAVVAVTGTATSEVATISLGQSIGKQMVFLGNLAAIFSMATSFLVLALALKWMLHYDYKLNKNVSWFLTCIVPFILFMLGIKSFIKTINFVGAIAGGIEGILIVFMFHKAKRLGEKKPEYEIKENRFILALLVIIFLLGIFYTILNFFKII